MGSNKSASKSRLEKCSKLYISKHNLYSACLLLLHFLLSESVTAGKVSYSGHKVLRIYPASVFEQYILDDLIEDTQLGLDKWSETPVEYSMDVLVPPWSEPLFCRYLDERLIRYKIEIPDVQKLIEEEERQLEENSVWHPNNVGRRRKRDAPIYSTDSQKGALGDTEPSGPLGEHNAHQGDSAAAAAAAHPVGAADSSSLQQDASLPKGELGHEEETTEQPFDIDNTLDVMMSDGFPGVASKFYKFNIVGHYARHGKINKWLDYAANAFPSFVSVETIGYSYEKRELKVIKIGTPHVQGNTKPAIWIDSGIHAREWITPSTAVYIIFTLIDQYGIDANVTSLVDTFDWYILPVFNPDGYEYSHEYDRFWRKTRSRLPKVGCVGVDANRNFDFQWLNCSFWRRCGSRRPCSNFYVGPQPFSEPETLAVAQFIQSKPGRFKMFFNLHSYTEMWLFPWAYTSTLAEDYNDLLRVSNVAVQALEAKHGVRFQVGPASISLDPAGGSSMDWAKGRAGIKYSFAPELRGKNVSFFVPQDQIVPVGEETWAGIAAAAKQIAMETKRNFLKNMISDKLEQIAAETNE